MLNIVCTFDREFVGIPGAGVDPLGEIVISDGDSEIRIANTYLDSWLAGLIDGLRQLEANKHARIETEEPEPIVMEWGPDRRVVISHRNERVFARGPREIELALRAAVHLFLTELKNTPDASRNRLIDPIRAFWVTTQN